MPSRLPTALRLAPLLARGVYEYNVASRFHPLPVREWMFPVTYRCNARCIMCDIWRADKHGELTVADWARILVDPLFQTVESINITGGEPTLRSDLGELVNMLLSRLPSLRRLTVTTNGLDTAHVVTCLHQIHDQCERHGTGLFVGVSLDGIGQVHDQMRNVERAFERVSETIVALRGMRVGINCTLTRHNLEDADNVLRWGLDHGLPVNLIPATYTDSYYANVAAESQLSIGEEAKPELLSLLQHLARRKTLSNLSTYYYADLRNMLATGQPRRTPCVFQRSGVIIDARGDMQYCMYGRILGNVAQSSAQDIYLRPENQQHRRDILDQSCPRCTISCFLELGLAKDALKYVGFLLRGHI